MSLSGHAYCWDVLDDPAFAGRAAGLGLGSVTLAASYHSVRAATPLHPRHQVVEAPHAALYRPVRPEAWRDRRLRPAAADWVPGPDPFGAAASLVRAFGLRVTAWVVLTHNTRLGTAFPDVAVVNCFGDRYPYALCPARDEVRDYAATLAAEAVRDAPVDAVSLESCGQLGVVHTGHHDKTADAWTPAAQRWLSVCCCAACRRGWRERGADPDRIVAGLRAAVRASMSAPGAGVLPDAGCFGMSASGAGVLPDAGRGGVAGVEAGVILDVRHAAAAALRAQVIAAVRASVPGIEVVLHANPDPWATGPSPGLPSGVLGPPDRTSTLANASGNPSNGAPAGEQPGAGLSGAGLSGVDGLPGVDVLLVPAWPVGAASVRAVAAAVAAGHRVHAYVTALPPVRAEELPEHARELVAAGATGLGLYHLGLAPSWRQDALRRVAQILELS